MIRQAHAQLDYLLLALIALVLPPVPLAYSISSFAAGSAGLTSFDLTTIARPVDGYIFETSVFRSSIAFEIAVSSAARVDERWS